MKNRLKKMPWEKKQVHKDSVRIKGAGVISFSKGRNSYGAKKDGKRIDLKRKWG